MVILIKLGGSVITDKSRYRTFNKERVMSLCQEIKRAGKKVIVIHGAGSFGHIIASTYSLDTGFKNEEQISAYARVCYDTRCLNLLVVKELNDVGLPAVSVPIGSCFMMENGELAIGDDSVLQNMFKLGVIPVTFGDVVLDSERGFTICSGDQVAEALVDIFHPSKVIFVSDVDGLFYEDPKYGLGTEFIRTIDEHTLDTVKTHSVVVDVTSGMQGKIETMLRISGKGCDCILINGTVKGRLLSLLEGNSVPCTVAKGK